MKCPKCGKINGKTNKFCRECGTALGVVVQPEPELQPQQAGTNPAPPVDDLALGSELFDVWQLYEAGELVAALEKGEKVVEKFPASTSAHSVMALICERIAERELTIGDAEVARDYLNMAMSEYKTILTINPESLADRQKLISIRSKLAGRKTVAPSDIVAKAKSKIKTLPPPVLAAGVVFIVIVTLATILTSGAKKTPSASKYTPSVQVVDSNASSASVTPSQTETAPGLRVYTFNTPSTTTADSTQAATQSYPRPSAPADSTPIPKISQNVQPIKLPPLGKELTLVAEPKKSVKKTNPIKPAQIKIMSPGRVSPKAAPAQQTLPQTTSSQADGSSLLAKAIQLHSMGHVDDAINTAEQAVSAYQSEIASGRNVDSAKRGAATANKYISFWRSN